MNRMRGAALVITVWLIALASVLALNYAQVIRGDTKITAGALARHQARAAAEAGIWRAVYELDSPDPVAPWPSDGRGAEFKFNGAEVRVNAQDLSGLVDLNTGSPETLRMILEHITQDPVRAEQIVDTIMDWRDRDHEVRAYGAEDRDYRAAGLDYEAKDGPFNTREELELLLGLSRNEYRQIAPFVTVHTQKRAVDFRVAPAHVLDAMPELSGAGFEAPDTGLATSTDPTPTRTRGQRTRRRGATFEIMAEAQVGGVLSRLAATVQINHGRRIGPKVAILSWRETWPMEIPIEHIDENPPAG